MNGKIKTALLAAAGLAAMSTAQAQYTPNNNDLILGFTTPASTGDLQIDLGSPASIGVGGGSTVDLIANGNVQSGSSELVTQLGQNGLSINSLNWGVVGGHFTSGANLSIYSTVLHGAAAPPRPGAPGTTIGAINSAGQGINDFPGTHPNQGVVDPTIASGESWREIISPGAGSASSFASTYYNPGTITPSSGSYSVSEDLYLNTATTESLLGTLTFTSTGGLSFAPAAVPEPSTYGLIAGLGVLALAIRRQFNRA
jgi:hypothetical protein